MKTTSPNTVAVVGANGYTGIELVRLLWQHPQVKIKTLVSRSQAGQLFSDYYPPLHDCTIPFSDRAHADIESCDAVFFATPHGVAMQEAPALLAAGVKVIDLSADFRLKNPDTFQAYYNLPHSAPELLTEAVYGLTEWHADKIARARLVAVPGCYPTAVQLGFAPLLNAHLIDPAHLIASCASGASGAGRKAETALLFGEVSDNFRAYGVSRHRHHPEMVQELAMLAGVDTTGIGLTFIPHLLPLHRGIHATLVARLHQHQHSVEALVEIYKTFYQDQAAIHVLPAGAHPDLKAVQQTVRVVIALHQPQPDTVVVLVVEDNLQKGAAGQALQCMNLMMGLPKNCGLIL